MPLLYFLAKLEHIDFDLLIGEERGQGVRFWMKITRRRVTQVIATTGFMLAVLNIDDDEAIFIDGYALLGLWICLNIISAM